MASIFDGIDTTNPCLVWPVLQTALYKLAAGEAEVRVRHEEFDVTLQPANQQELGRLVTKLKTECERKSGRRVRFAARGSF
ncbi:hypothetical protein [Roseibium suaedae]|uniref:GpW protein n=1 Tax=Roseibium suaedae TaxID=735517 RepID=A0A1M7D8Q2_9HYPH|nr:hypothetical protein [Roseibium suaedae]SHL75854.1 gpW protein [Roseibium suaedae]